MSDNIETITDRDYLAAQQRANAAKYDLLAGLATATDATRALMEHNVNVFAVGVTDTFVHINCGNASIVPGVREIGRVTRAERITIRALFMDCVLEWEQCA